MRKLLILCFLCFTWIARGQDEYRWHYWFDANHDAVVSGTTQSRYFTIDADASNLDFGAHTFNFQVEGKDGKSSSPISKYFYYSNSKLDKLTYWFDNDTQSMKEESGKDGHFILDVSSVEPGIHFINLMLRDASGRISEIKQECFYRVINKTATKLTYWFDDDESTKETIAFHDGTSMFDVSKLEEGFHTISIVTHDYTSSAIATRMFIKVPQTQGGDFDMVCLCSVDGKLVAQDRLPSTGGILNFNLDVNNIDPGLHKALFQTITPTGAASNIVERYFIRTTTNNEIGTMKCLYSIDDAKTYTQAGNFANGLFHFDLDVASLADGLHRLAYMLIADNGVSTPMQSAFFWKTPVGGNAITQYEYWLNDNEANAKKVTLTERKNPYSLITLLPIESCPIRSSCFQFEVKDGKPMMYARNDIHFRFFDVAARLTEATKQFVDYSISQEVTDIAELQSTQTFARPEENGIKWFRFEAAPGDTVAFKASQATTLQVFAPSGKEIYATSGDKSVVYGGTHAWEDGTYYVAVHDVTGSKSSVTLDYMHMDKYDVVDQDVRVVGNGGCSTITYQGNGFRDLYAVDLKDSRDNIIESIDVGHENDATTTVTFDFTDARLGKYDAVFHFTGEDKTFANNITVEEAKEIELINSVKYNGTFLIGREAEFTLKIVNNSNMTAYSVPVQIEVRSGKSVEDIKVVCDRFSASEFILSNNSIDPVLQDVLKEELPKLGTLSDFFVLKDGNGQLYYRAEYSMTLLPNSETVITTLVNSRLATEVYYIVPSDWAALSTKPIENTRRMARAKGLDAICCNKERIKCVANIANLIGGFTPYGCATSIGNEIVEQTLEGMCPDEGQVKQSLNKRVKSIAGSIMNVLIDCVTGHFDDLAKGIRKALKGIEEQIGNVSKQISKLSQERDEAYQSFRYLRSKATEAFNNNDADAYKIWMDQADEAFKKGQSFDNEIVGLGKQKDDLLTQQAAKNKDLFDCREGLSNAIKGIRDNIADMITESSCYKAFIESKMDCPPPYPGGGSSTPVNSYDPNDIYGYVAPSGSKFISEEVVTVPYRIEFENDTTFASSAAHTVIVKDTLDKKMFDLSTYQPTSIKIGDKDVQLKGDKEFVTTIDMRPEIYAIAQVEGLYDAKKGIATWRFTSLDPMTMEPTDDIMQGFLPVNHDGRGIGEVAYEVSRKSDLQDGTVIANKASIVFDSNAPILTPTWTNTVDAVPPTSRVCGIEVVSDTIVHIRFDGSDNRSGVWKYALYVQYGENTSWNQVAETDTTCFDLRYYENIDYGFCVVATDSAGNVEKKVIQREYKFLNGEGGVIDAISLPYGEQVATDRAYDLSGRLIQEEGYRGIVIKNRKKLIKR